MITKTITLAAFAVGIGLAPTAHADPRLTPDEQAYVDQLKRDHVTYVPPEGWAKLGHQICADLPAYPQGVNAEVAGLVARGASQADAQNLVLDASIQLCCR